MDGAGVNRGRGENSLHTERSVDGAGGAMKRRGQINEQPNSRLRKGRKDAKGRKREGGFRLKVC